MQLTYAQEESVFRDDRYIWYKKYHLLALIYV